TQREFLEKALRFYERMAASEDSSPEVQREAGKAAQRAAEIQLKLGDSSAAEKSFLRSVALLEGLPHDDLARAELASTHNIYGWYLWTVGKPPEAEFQRSLEIGEELSARRPDLVLVRRVLGRAYSSFGIIQAARGQFKEAEASHGRAVAIRSALQKEFPNDPIHRVSEARSHANLVTLYRQTGRFRDADTTSTRAVEIITPLVKEFPRDPSYRADLAHDLNERANLLSLLGKRDDAEAFLREALEIADRLVAEFPRSVGHRDLASAVRRDLAVQRRDRGKAREAE